LAAAKPTPTESAPVDVVAFPAAVNAVTIDAIDQDRSDDRTPNMFVREDSFARLVVSSYAY